MNTALLIKVAEKILLHPEHLDMDEWVVKKGENKCGSTGCIAGWTAYLYNNPDRELIWSDMYHIFYNHAVSPEEMLDITLTERTYLFFVNNWPERWRIRYNNTDQGSFERAKVVHDYIHYFIETKGDPSRLAT